MSRPAKPVRTDLVRPGPIGSGEETRALFAAPALLAAARPSHPPPDASCSRFLSDPRRSLGSGITCPTARRSLPLKPRVRGVTGRARPASPARSRGSILRSAARLGPSRQRAGLLSRATPRGAAAARPRDRGGRRDGRVVRGGPALLCWRARDLGTARPSRPLPAGLGGASLRAAVADARGGRRPCRGLLPSPADLRSRRRYHRGGYGAALPAAGDVRWC